MNDMNKATLDYYVELIDNKLLELTHSKPELQGQVVEAMEYSLQAGGKRLRPVLMLEFCRMCGERQPEKYAEIACSIELIHTFLLYTTICLVWTMMITDVESPHVIKLFLKISHSLQVMH